MAPGRCAMNNAKPRKLADGSWGATVQGRAFEGDRIRITTRSGKSWEAQVTGIVRFQGSETVVRTMSLDERPRARRPRQSSYSEFCGGICPVNGHRCTRNNPCHDCE